LGLGPQYAYVGWIHDFQVVHYIRFVAVLFLQVDPIANFNVLQPTEEAIAVTGDTYISILAKVRRALDVSNSTVQGYIVCTLEHGRLHVNSADAKHRQWRREMLA